MRTDCWFVANIWPDEVPELRSALMTYFAHANRVAELLLGAFTIALGLPPGHLRAHTTHSTDTMRTIRYTTPPEPGHIDRPADADGRLGMGAHTDYGIVTVLCADPVPGLETVGSAGGWIPVTPKPGALVNNIGDLLAQWTNDRWRSTIHRVVPPNTDRTRRAVRRSMAFFHDGNHDAVIACLPGCSSDTNPPRSPPVRAEDHLCNKLLGPRTLRGGRHRRRPPARRTADDLSPVLTGPGRSSCSTIGNVQGWPAVEDVTPSRDPGPVHRAVHDPARHPPEPNRSWSGRPDGPSRPGPSPPSRRPRHSWPRHGASRASSGTATSSRAAADSTSPS